ncbi:MAG: SPASM domain-containing protein [Myxococcaceae bacterium]|nr:SPASM domain-containing protein [Myxococcaceae bacterium]
MRAYYPRHLSIETSDWCNRGCAWCPIQRDHPGHRPRLLDFAVYSKLLDELRDAPHPLKVTLQWIDEPLSNPRFLDYARLLRERVPEATLLLQTNGDFLTPPLLASLRATFDAITVNLYAPKTHQRLISLGLAPAQPADRSLRKPGRLPVRSGPDGATLHFNEKYRSDEWVEHHDQRGPGARCDRLWVQAAIGFDGAVHVCCRDNLKQHPVGSLTTHSLFEAYNSPTARALRALMTNRERHAIAMCVTCPMSFREKVPPLSASALERLKGHVRDSSALEVMDEALAAPSGTFVADDAPELRAQQAVRGR